MNTYRITSKPSGTRNGGHVIFADDDYSLARPDGDIDTQADMFFIKDKEGSAYLASPSRITQAMQDQAATLVLMEFLRHDTHEFVCSEELAKELATTVSRLHGHVMELMHMVPFNYIYEPKK